MQHLINNQIHHFSQSDTVKNIKLVQPFWNKKLTPTSKPRVRKRVKFAIKWIKFITYSFIFIISLWGCFQQFGQTYTVYIPSVGQGLEFGYTPGTTGDWRFDLGYSGTGSYYVFSDYSLTYGPFIAWFVYPVAKFMLALMWAMTPGASYGGFGTLFAILILLLIMRFISFWPTLKTSFLSERQMEHQGAIAEINAKYANVPKTDKQARMRKQQELQEYNRKHKLNPLGALENLIVSMPIFLIIFKVVTILRPIKATVLFGIWDLSAIPFTSIFQEISDGGWVYIFLMLLIMPVQFLGQKLPMILAKKRNKNARTISVAGMQNARKQQKIQTIMSFVFIAFTLFISSGVGVYYFFSGLITIAQTIIIHKIVLKRRKQGVGIDDQLKRLGILEESENSPFLFFKK